MKIHILLLFLVFSEIAVSQVKTSETRSSFVRDAKSLHKVKEGQKYEFGYLRVPENRSNPDSKLIELPVYIFKSRSSNPKKDPIIYLVGGPGSSIMNAVPYMNYYRYLDDRDFILFEQRGTEYAKPNLACPDLAKAFNQAELLRLMHKENIDIVENAVGKCRQKLIKKEIDLNGYNSLETAADIQALRKHLGIEEYNLLTVSYGTKIAQIIMRDYPEGLRSVVMDSPLPLEANYDLSSAENIKIVYDKLFNDCRSDSLCNLNYPRLEERFYDFINYCNETPIELNIKVSGKGKTQKYFVQGADLFYFIADLNTSQILKAPLIINQILEGNYEAIEAQIISLAQGRPQGHGLGMRLSVWCSEETSFIVAEDEKRSSTTFPFLQGESTLLYSRELCEIWNVNEAIDKENEPINSDIPALLISGEYDTFTPYKWANAMLSHLENAHHIIFKGWQHSPTTYWSNPCGMESANEFFNNPRKIPQPECLSKIKRPDFVIE